uniref:Uncharacterized protein n=1 Tax=Vitis vinifera TaxID=29760 RepID=F6I5A2_VITVI
MLLYISNNILLCLIFTSDFFCIHECWEA